MTDATNEQQQGQANTATQQATDNPQAEAGNGQQPSASAETLQPITAGQAAATAPEANTPHGMTLAEWFQAEVKEHEGAIEAVKAEFEQQKARAKEGEAEAMAYVQAEIDKHNVAIAQINEQHGQFQTFAHLDASDAWNKIKALFAKLG